MICDRITANRITAERIAITMMRVLAAQRVAGITPLWMTRVIKELDAISRVSKYSKAEPMLDRLESLLAELKQNTDPREPCPTPPPA
jgi:hypothetical protein